MVDYQRQVQFVSSLRLDTTKLVDALEVCFADVDEFGAVGGQPFYETYFNDPEAPEVPKITFNEFLEAITTLTTIKTYMMGGNSTPLYKIKG